VILVKKVSSHKEVLILMGEIQTLFESHFWNSKVQTKRVIGANVDIFMNIFIFGEWQDFGELSSVCFMALFEILGATKK